MYDYHNIFTTYTRPIHDLYTTYARPVRPINAMLTYIIKFYGVWKVCRFFWTVQKNLPTFQAASRLDTTTTPSHDLSRPPLWPPYEYYDFSMTLPKKRSGIGRGPMWSTLYILCKYMESCNLLDISTTLHNVNQTFSIVDTSGQFHWKVEGVVRKSLKNVWGMRVAIIKNWGSLPD